jgi:hypothetical protein
MTQYVAEELQNIVIALPEKSKRSFDEELGGSHGFNQR